MKLLSKPEVDLKYKKQNDELIEKNSRLAGFLSKGINRLNSLKDNYDQEKINKLKEYEDFCLKVQKKKGELLEELEGIATQVEKKKEVYYALIAKQDELDEKEFKLNQKEQKLTEREKFTKETEDNLQAKWNTILGKPNG